MQIFLRKFISTIIYFQYSFHASISLEIYQQTEVAWGNELPYVLNSRFGTTHYIMNQSWSEKAWNIFAAAFNCLLVNWILMVMVKQPKNFWEVLEDISPQLD